LVQGAIEVNRELYDAPDKSIYYLSGNDIHTRLARPTPNHVWDIEAESWLLDLTALRHSQSFKVDQACKLAIVSGFVSYALGDPYQYPSKTTDQQNLAASVLDSYDPDNNSDWTTPFWCLNEAGEWAFRPHTAAQIREVGRNAKSAILACQFKNEQLQAAIAAADTTEEIEAITW